MNKTAGASCLLEGIGLRKEFPRPEGPLVVLDDSHFQLREKEAVAVVGASGSGKSTFLNILGALDTPTAGELRYRGRPLDTHNQQVVDQWRLARVGFVFQTHMLLPDFTAYENLLLPVRVRGAVPREHRERARRFLAAIGLEDRATHLPGQLSGGEQQRIALARAFMNRPEIVLADEPFGNLDREIGGRLGEMLFRLRDEEDVSLVIVT
ncbi:hypothetical protein CSA17_04405, partial [bacterium DOLJORAL78_65_58]